MVVGNLSFFFPDRVMADATIDMLTTRLEHHPQWVDPIENLRNGDRSPTPFGPAIFRNTNEMRYLWRNATSWVKGRWGPKGHESDVSLGGEQFDTLNSSSTTWTGDNCGGKTTFWFGA